LNPRLGNSIFSFCYPRPFGALTGRGECQIEHWHFGSGVRPFLNISTGNQCVQQSRLLLSSRPSHLLPAPNLRRVPRASKVLRGRKALKASKGFRVRRDLRVREENQALRDRPWHFVCRPRNRQGLEDAVPGCLGRAPHSLDFRFLLLGRRGRGVRGFYIFRLLHYRLELLRRHHRNA
jgi:hypothetical protein